MKLVPFGVNYVLYVGENRKHVHSIVRRRTGVPTSIKLLVIQKWKEWCKLKPQQIRNVMTTARVNTDISEENAQDFKLLFQDDQVMTAFGRLVQTRKRETE
jgi:hypothetical protein